ncbi:MAG: sulfatase-like hydrolase/transferase, partial [Clostridia bacterium]
MQKDKKTNLPQDGNNDNANIAPNIDDTTQTAIVGDTPIDTASTPKDTSNAIIFDKKIRPFEMTVFAIGALLMLLQWCVGLNIMTLIGAIYMIGVSVIIFIMLFTKKRLSLWTIVGFVAVSFGIATFYIFNGADAGWGGFTTAVTGFFSGKHPLWQGEGNFGTRLAGNILIASPTFLLLLAMFFVVNNFKNGSIALKNGITKGLSLLLVVMSVVFIFTTNLRAKPKGFDLSKGEKDYLDNVNKNVDSSNPNVLVIMMDDLGYGDTSFNAKKANITPAFNTPNIDWLAQTGLDFDNFYASYSVCSPSRFALMTGRYPYRGSADNVVYPTVNSITPFASTRLFNSFEMGDNCDGMRGDEITIAETLKS